MHVHVLLVEDNNALAANIADYLSLQGFAVDVAGNGLTGLHLAATQPFDVIILDLGLPGIDGLEICRLLRRGSTSAVPILMLTARDRLEEKLAGFEAGADDYLVKPFALRELEARVRALVRRGYPRTELVVADLVLDLERRTVHRGGQPIELPRTPLRLLEILMRAPGKVLERRELENLLWEDEPPESDALRTHIHTLRQAIDRPFDVPLLKTVRGIGWMIEDPALVSR